MRQILRAAVFVLMTGSALAPAHAADVLYGPPRSNPPPPQAAYPEPYPYPAPYYPGYGWVTYLPIASAPPLPPPLPWEPFPNCCPDPYSSYLPSFP